MMPLSCLRVCFICLLSFASVCPAQNSLKLKEEKKALEEKIQLTEQLLASTQNQKDSTTYILDVARENLLLRERALQMLFADLQQIQVAVNQTTMAYNQSRSRLAQQKKQYQQLAVLAYKNSKEYDALLFVLSAPDFDKAMHRVKYVEENFALRKRLIVQIKQEQVKLDSTQKVLQNQLKQQKALYQAEQMQKRKLESTKQQQESMLAALQGREEELRKAFQAQNKAKQDLENRIIDLIRKEEEERKNAKEDPHVLRLTQQFEKQKGKLPYPVQKSFVSSEFGRHPHKVLKYVWENNNGIDLTTQTGEFVYAVHEGFVTAVIAVPNAGYSVIVSHGNYRSIYSNLETVFVKKSQALHSSQVLGKVLTHPVSQRTVFHFEIWKTDKSNISQLNPLLWLEKQ
jgi:murein hydrolase activator